METSDIILNKIIEKVNPVYSCPLCGNNKATLIDGLLNNYIVDFKKMGSVQLGGTSVPVAMLACTKCGFISQHSIGVLFNGIDNYNKEIKK